MERRYTNVHYGRKENSIPGMEQTSIGRMAFPSLDRHFPRAISRSPFHVVTKANKFVCDLRTIFSFVLVTFSCMI